MTITRHTATDLFFLISAAFICGIAIACIYLLMLSASSIVSAFKCTRFLKYRQFMVQTISQVNCKIVTAVTDVMLCLLFAIGLLSVSFICNSGNFRLSALAAMLCGHMLGCKMLAKLVRMLILNALFAIKRCLDILLLPIVWTVQRILSLFALISKKALTKRNDRWIAKYTAQRLSQIDKDTEFGLIEEYYKEFLK